MNEYEFRASVKDFERVIVQGERFSKSGEQLGCTLALLFAMKSAYAICTFLLKSDSGQEDLKVEVLGRRGCAVPPHLPQLSRVRVAAPKLAEAASPKGKFETMQVLRDSGVADLCAIPHEQLLRMDLVGRKITGRALEVVLVELSLFAVEIGDLHRASTYVQEALQFAPRAWELHNLCVLEGLFALKAGQNRDAVRSLYKSISVCEVDEYASLDCGVRAPNFMLAQELLEHGETEMVITYLTQCKNIWRSFQLPISKLIGRIEDGERVDLQTSEFVRALNQASYKLQMQWMRARCLEEAEEFLQDTQTSKSPEEITDARMRIAEKCQRDINERVNDTIRYLDTDEPKQ